MTSGTGPWEEVRLRPILNPDSPPSGDMLDALVWLETRCRMQGQTDVTESEVRRFLAEEGGPDLAATFVTEHLMPLDGLE